MNYKFQNLLMIFLTIAGICGAGIDSPRVANTGVIIDDLPPSPGSLRLERVFPQLEFSDAIMLREVPDGSNRLAVCTLSGFIYTFPKVADPAPGDVETFLDISSQVCEFAESGFQSFAFDPDYATNGRVYVFYNENSSCGNVPGPTSRISRLTAPNPSLNIPDLSSEEILIELPQPSSRHNGGCLQFGHDGYLYASLGDGGLESSSTDAQNTENLLGSIIRIDVTGTPDQGLPYSIPIDNPFYNGGPAGANSRKEIWAYGFRNPFRFYFDQLNGTLFLGDTGQDDYEELNVVEKGGNYGWPVMEGPECYSGNICDPSPYKLPLTSIEQISGNYIASGGPVYLGDEVPSLYGYQIFASYHEIHIVLFDGENLIEDTLAIYPGSVIVVGMGQDLDGEVYILDFAFGGAGGIYVIRPSSTPAPNDFPTKLSDIPELYQVGSGTGHLVDGILPYEPSAPLWSDGAYKERYLALPNLEQIDFTMNTGWDMPDNTTIIKNFLLPLDERNPEATLKRIETRLMVKNNGDWYGFSYEWDEDETDAQLLTGRKERSFEMIDENGSSFDYTWVYPSRSDCQSCHTSSANHVLGLNTANINHEWTYPNNTTSNQLEEMESVGYFSSPLPAIVSELPASPDYRNQSESLTDRFKSYVDSNCAMCHTPGGPAPTAMDFRWETPLSQMFTVNEQATGENFGLMNPDVVEPGEPDESVLLLRMESLNSSNRMPPLATSRVDEETTEMIREFIFNLGISSAHSGWTNYH